MSLLSAKIQSEFVTDKKTVITHDNSFDDEDGMPVKTPKGQLNPLVLNKSPMNSLPMF